MWFSAMTNGNKQYFCLDWRRFVPFANQEVVLAAQDIQQNISRLNIFVLETENVASIEARYDAGVVAPAPKPAPKGKHVRSFKMRYKFGKSFF